MFKLLSFENDSHHLLPVYLGNNTVSDYWSVSSRHVLCNWSGHRNHSSYKLHKEWPTASHELHSKCFFEWPCSIIYYNYQSSYIALWVVSFISFHLLYVTNKHFKIVHCACAWVCAWVLHTYGHLIHFLLLLFIMHQYSYLHCFLYWLL